VVSKLNAPFFLRETGTIPERVNFAIPIDEARGIIRKAYPLEFTPSAKTERLTGQQIFDGARKATVLIIASRTAKPALSAAPSAPSDQDALILRILKAVETHDYRTLLIYTLDKETDYFGHKNSSSAFIQQDMTQDARSYKWCRFVPDLSTFQTSLGHDSIEYDSDALDVRGKEHKARCRLDIYYTPTTSPRLQALSLKVLPNHLQSGNSGSTVTGPASGRDDESGVKNAAQNINSWTPQNLKAHFGAATAQYVHGKIETITFSAGPHGVLRIDS
jgi:hypothetical protein